MSNIPVATAQIVGLWMECIFYGILLVTFGLCMHILLFKPKSRQSSPGAKTRSVQPPIRWNMVLVALAMFVFASLDVAFGLRHNLDAFVYYTGPGGASAEFSLVSYWVDVMKSADFVAQSTIGDAMLIYRCWIVYGKKGHIIIVPMMIWTGLAVCSCIVIWAEATLKRRTLLRTNELTPFLVSCIVITLALNIIVTSAIVYKIWKVNRQSMAFALESSSTRAHGCNGTRLSRAMRIIIESGLMYTVSVAILVIVYLAGNNSYYGVSDCIVQIVGIAFNLIIIRAHQGSTSEYTSSVYTKPSAMGFQLPYERPERDRRLASIITHQGQHEEPIELESSTGSGMEEDRKSFGMQMEPCMYPLGRVR